MDDLRARADGGQILNVKHGASELRKDVVCVSGDSEGTLCATPTPDHIVKYYGKRYSMGEVCEMIECYKKKNARVVNPVLRTGIIKSPLDGFELTDEVDIAYVPRFVTIFGARFLAAAIETRNSMGAMAISSIALKGGL